MIAISCQAQFKNFVIYASGNYPIIKDVEAEHQTIPIPIPAATGYASFVTTGGIKQSFKSRIGFEIGGRFDYSLTSKFFITSGLSLGYLQFQRTAEITHLTSDIQLLPLHNLPTTVGEPFGTIHGSFRWRDAQGNVIPNPPVLPQRSDRIGNTTTLSVQVPLLFGTSFLEERLEVRTGAMFSYLLRATQIKEQYAASTQSLSEYKDDSKAGFNEFQAGIAVQSSYLLGRKFSLDLTAQKFFTSIYDSDNSGGHAKYNVVTLGLSYLL